MVVIFICVHFSLSAEEHNKPLQTEPVETELELYLDDPNYSHSELLEDSITSVFPQKERSISLSEQNTQVQASHQQTKGTGLVVLGTATFLCSSVVMGKGAAIWMFEGAEKGLRVTGVACIPAAVGVGFIIVGSKMKKDAHDIDLEIKNSLIVTPYTSSTFDNYGVFFSYSF